MPPPVELRSARHILVETEDEADALVAELADGADFAELAGEHSTDGSAQRGGDLGAQPRGSYVEPFEVAVWDAEIGVVVGPVESMYGFHIIEVTDESTAPASDLSNEQADQLIGQEFASILADAFNDADVEVAPELGVWDPQAVAVVDGEQVGSTDQP